MFARLADWLNVSVFTCVPGGYKRGSNMCEAGLGAVRAFAWGIAAASAGIVSFTFRTSTRIIGVVGIVTLQKRTSLLNNHDAIRELTNISSMLMQNSSLSKHFWYSGRLFESCILALEVQEQSRLKCCLGRIVQVPCSGNYPKVPLASVVHTRPADFVSSVQCQAKLSVYQAKLQWASDAITDEKKLVPFHSSEWGVVLMHEVSNVCRYELHYQMITFGKVGPSAFSIALCSK